MDLRKKVYGYTRVSTFDQAEKGDSLECQSLNITNYCAMNNLNLLDIYVDAGISGAIPPFKRPMLSKLLHALYAGFADGFVACKIDRISRSIRDFILLIADFKKEDLLLYVISPDINASTPSGKFSLHLLSAIGELERDMTSERTKEVMKMKKNKNELIGSVPFGKRLIGNTNILEDDPEEQQTIQIVKELREQVTIVDKKIKKMSYADICKELVKLERKNKEGQSKFFPSQIGRMLLNGSNHKPKKQRNKKNMENEKYLLTKNI